MEARKGPLAVFIDRPLGGRLRHLGEAQPVKILP